MNISLLFIPRTCNLRSILLVFSFPESSLSNLRLPGIMLFVISIWSLHFLLLLEAEPTLRKFYKTTLCHNKGWPHSTWTFLGTTPFKKSNHALQAIENFIWSLLLFDATLTHMLYCSWNLLSAYTNQSTDRLLRSRKLAIFLNFQYHTQEFQHYKVCSRPL